MKRMSITAALAAALFTLPAAAQELDPVGVEPAAPVAGKTRAEVKAELAAARARGELNHGEADPHGLNHQRTPSTKTRAEVRADARNGKPVTVFVYPLGA